MNRCWCAVVWIVVLAGCALEPPPVPPTATPGITVRPVDPPTPTLVPTPTATVTPTPVSPAATASTSPPAPSTSPAAARPLRSYCQQSFGPQNNIRFRGRFAEARVQERADHAAITIMFDDVDGALHGVAGCAWAGTWPRRNDLGAFDAPDAAFIALQLDDWAHDDAFATSVFTETVIVEDTGQTPPGEETTSNAEPISFTLAFAANTGNSRGALLGIGLPEPRPFAVRVDDDQIVVEIAHGDAAPFPPADDPLGQAAGAAPADLDMITLENGALYRADLQNTVPITATVGTISALAVNPDQTQLALCAASDQRPPALWITNVDGSGARVLADVGGCAEPAWNTDGDTVAFVAPANGNAGALSTVWTVPVGGGDAVPVGESIPGRSRTAPRWLDDVQLVYRAASDDGTSLLLLNDGAAERELSVRLLTGTAYRAVGAFVIDPGAALIAVEALHADDDGSDLVLMRADGSLIATEQRGFRQRPLGFTNDGLLYLSTDCPGDAVQHYTLRRRNANGAITTVVSGSTAYVLGSTTTHTDALAYVRAAATDDTTAQHRYEAWLLSSNGATRTALRQSGSTIEEIVVLRVGPP